MDEARKSKIQKALKENNMEMAPGGPKKTIQPNPKLRKISGSKPMEGNTFKTFTKEVPEGSREHKQYLKTKSNIDRTKYKIGGKVCKMAKKGKGKAYGRNS